VKIEREMPNNNITKQNPFLGAVAGSVGAVFALSLTFPLKVIKQRLQADSGNPVSVYDGPIHCARLTVKKEGLRGLFTGITLALPNTAVWNFVFYFFFTLLRPIWESRKSKTARFVMLRSIFHGISAGIMTQLVMLPSDCVNLRRTIQTKAKRKNSNNEEEKGAEEKSEIDEGNVYLKIVQEIYEEGGIFAFWKGLVPGLCLTINPGIVQLIRKFMTDSIIKRRSGRGPTSYENFQIGLVAKLVASSITYPLVVCKVLMSVKRKTSSNPNSSSSFGIQEFANVMKSVAQKGGLYNGIKPHLTQAAFKAGILNMVRLKILELIVHAFGTP